MICIKLFGYIYGMNFFVSDNLMCSVGGFYFDAEYIIKDVCYNADGTEYLEIINQERPYLYNLSRIKAYLSAFARIKTARLALKN